MDDNQQQRRNAMVDRIIAFLALCGLIIFCSVLVYYVRRLDLAIVIVVCVLFAAYDLLFSGHRPPNGADNGRKL
jgi:hypothetical protein